MIFGKKSDVKKHFSSKHSMFSHKRIVDHAPNQTAGQVPDNEQSPEQPPTAKVEKREDAPTKV